MPLTCNIDQTGRRFRVTIGILCLVIGLALLAFAWAGHGLAAGITGGAFCAAAVFCVGQGLLGYCVVRVMGFRTRF